MIERVKFICELCGRAYDNAESAKECEQKHIAIEKIEKIFYSQSIWDDKVYPDRIVIKFVDGKQKSYEKMIRERMMKNEKSNN